MKDLYESDEVAWLEKMVGLIKNKDYVDLDYESLIDFLESAAARDRREVLSRLTALMAQILKVTLKPWMEMDSWRGAVFVHRRHLQDLLESATLRRYACEVLGRAYERAVNTAAAETGMEESSFPAECPYTIETLLVDE